MLAKRLKCSVCGREYLYDMRRGHTKLRCNSCVANMRGIDFKRRIVEHMGGACQRCGYSRCAGALHVHHKDPKAKRFVVSAARSRRWSTVLAELERCELLCANCHAEEHYNEDRWRRQYAVPRRRLPERKKAVWPTNDLLGRWLAKLPLTTIAKRIGVSDQAVRKHCRRHGLPVPRNGRGFWTKKRAKTLR